MVPMTKVEIIGHHRHLEHTLDLLHGLRLIELVDLRAEGVGEGGRDPFRSYTVEDAQVRRADELRYLETRLEALLQLLPVGARSPAAASTTLSFAELDGVARELDAAGPGIEASARALDALRTESSTLPRQIRSLERLLPLMPELPDFDHFETIAVVFEQANAALLLDLRRALQQMLRGRFEIVSSGLDSDTVAAVLVIPRDVSADVHELLGREQVGRVRLPSALEGLPLVQAIAAMQRRAAELPAVIDDARARLEAALSSRLERWEAARRVAGALVDQLQQLEKLATTNHTFLVVGWVPEPELVHLEQAMRDTLGPEVVLRRRSLSREEREQMPVLLQNPPVLRAFEYLLRLFALPPNGSFDATWVLALFIPLFFGLMLGDVGYGVVLLGVTWVVRRRLGPSSVGLRHVSTVLLLGAASAIVFGFLFGELFGDLGHRVGLRPLWLERETAIGSLMATSVAIGAGHVTFALVLGVWVAARQGQRALVLERAGRLAALLGLFAVALWMMYPDLRAALFVGIGAVGLGAVAVIVAHGRLGLILAPLEILRTATNVLSYLRLAALGLASVFLARTANELGSAAPIGVGILVATSLHALNLLLGAFSPTVQALRLHYVEWLGQLHEHGGRAFQPFGGEMPAGR